VIGVWNSLPLETITASSANLYKKKLDSVDICPYMLEKY